MKNHYEVVLARKYYGAHATGSVLLRNGYPEYHDKTREVNRFYRRLMRVGIQGIMEGRQ
jgi:hypothetical protein